MTGNPSFSRHEFDLLNVPVRCRIDLCRATSDDLRVITEIASREIPGELAAGEVVQRVIVDNPNSLLVFKREQSVVGGWSMLMLSTQGLENLLVGQLDASSPRPADLAARAEAPAAIYVWAVVAPRLASEGIRHVSTFLRQPLYSRANLYSRPNTDVGVALNLSLGFRPIEATSSGLYRYVRMTNRPSEGAGVHH